MLARWPQLASEPEDASSKNPGTEEEMCGIYASVGFPPDPQRLDVIAHRGPDGRGWREFQTPLGPLALGHRRLSIIDVEERAAQPMQAADGRFWITYNGEIYNYLELRQELVARGLQFQTTSDTEVLLKAFAEWGEDVLSRLVGMFAFVIWDARDNTLFAARDRYGIKPLFVHSSPQGIAFASEIKQLLGLPGLGTKMNMPRVYDFLSSGITDHTAETLFLGVRQLRGGECVRLSFDRWAPGQDLPLRRYAHLPDRDLEHLSEREAADTFRSLFLDSVRLHLRSDVAVGSCLSGGLDSSSIVCAMSDLLRPSGGQVHTISACYPEKEVDEKPFMDSVVAATGAVPLFVYPKAEDVFSAAERITWHQDEPYGSTSIFAQWSVFAAARSSGVKVMLDGQGADEQLAGYHGAFFYRMDELIRERRWLEILRTFHERKHWHGSTYRSQFASHILPKMPPALRPFFELFRRTAAPGGLEWMGSEALRSFAPSAGSTFAEAAGALGYSPVRDVGDYCMAMVGSTNLGMLLRYEDRNSMAHSVEARVPFLDHRLVDFNLRLGNSHKVVGGDTKRVLRSAMKGILPEDVRVRRDKLGFATPEQRWFRGPLRELVLAGIDETLNRYPGLLVEGPTRALTAEMLDGRRPLDFTLWRIINLGIWGRQFSVSA